MWGILGEILLVLVVVALVGRKAWHLALHRTAWGVRHVQTQNRRRLESAATLRCPIHGAQLERELVRLDNGERLCPRCYADTLAEHRP